MFIFLFIYLLSYGGLEFNSRKSKHVDNSPSIQITKVRVSNEVLLSLCLEDCDR